MTYSYLDAVKKDVERFITDEGFDLSIYDDADEAHMDLYDRCWIEDCVTGNGSGSYTFNRNRAKEYVFADPDVVADALKEFGSPAEDIAEHFLDQDWEWFDVTARCHILWQALEEVLNEKMK